MRAHGAAEVLPFAGVPLSFEGLANGMREGLVVLDGGNRVVHLNPAAAAMLGVSGEVAQGDGLETAFGEIANNPLPLACLKARRRGVPVDEEFFFGQARIWLEIRIVPHGRHLLLYFHQRPLRRRAERHLAENLERFELIAQTTSDLIWDWNVLEGRIWRSEATVKFLDEAGVPRATSRELWMTHILECERDRVRHEFNRIMRGPESRGRLEYPIKGKDGQIVHLSERILVLRDQHGRAIRAVGCMRDVSGQRHLETQLQRAQRLESVGRVAGGIAHDLNNILTPISMALDMLTLDANDSHERQVMESLQNSISHGASLLRILLMFARGSEGEKVALDPQQLVIDVIRIARETFPRTVHLAEEFARKLPAVIGNPTQLRQVLLNLLMNARDAIGGEGVLKIGARVEYLNAKAAGRLGLESGSHVVFSVVDNGPGIPPEILDKIWDPFFTTKEEGQGTGLGLSTAIAIVEAHHGIIQVASSPGAGTTFTIYLPAPDNALGAPPASGRSLTVLLADADSSIRKTTTRILEKRGHAVIGVATGTEAQEELESGGRRIDLLILDITHPSSEPFAMIASLRSRFPALPIIATASHGTDETRPSDDQPEFNAFLPKPFTGPELLARIEKVLETATDPHE